jgi:hypothetical protein
MLFFIKDNKLCRFLFKPQQAINATKHLLLLD